MINVSVTMPNERELMNDVLYFLREGKTRDEVFRLTGVDSNQIDTWYRKGKNNPTSKL